METQVIKSDGTKQLFDPNKVNVFVERALEGLEGVSLSELVLGAGLGDLTSLEEIKSSDITDRLIFYANSLVAQEPNYSYVAARMLLSRIYKEVGVTEDNYGGQFRSYILQESQGSGRLHGHLHTMFDLVELQSLLDPTRDLKFNYIGLKNIYDRYLYRDDSGRVRETPQYFLMRVGMGVGISDEDPMDFTRKFYDITSNHLAYVSSPTLFNGGTVTPQMSSCYLTEFGDSIVSIYGHLQQEALKSSKGGGLGQHLTKLRAADSPIRSTGGKASGIVPWAKNIESMLLACDQSGKRKGAGAIYLEPWHLDYEEFLDLRKEGDPRLRTHDLFTAAWVPDLFMKYVKEGKDWYMFCPSQAVGLADLWGESFEHFYIQYCDLAEQGLIRHKKIPARTLWKKVLNTIGSTSMPWQTFKDTANRRYPNKHAGVIHGSNLCTEIYLHTKASQYDQYGNKTEVGETAVCNLCSLNLPAFVKDGVLDYDKLHEVTMFMIRSLDNVVTGNYYPTEEALKFNMAYRPVGLGTMGWANMYARLGIAPDSEAAIEMADNVTEYVAWSALCGSVGLAEIRGEYPGYAGSDWDQGILPIDTYHGEKTCNFPDQWEYVRGLVKAYGVRNSTMMAIAPNASIAYQLGSEQSVEPINKVIWDYKNLSGNIFHIVFDFYDELRRRGIFSRDLCKKVLEAKGDVTQVPEIPSDLQDIWKPAFECNMANLIKANGRRQKWIDQGISFNLYNSKNSLKEMSDNYMLCWEEGLKGTYYVHSKPASKTTRVQKKVKEAPKDQTTCSLEAMANGGTCEACEG